MCFCSTLHLFTRKGKVRKGGKDAFGIRLLRLWRLPHFLLIYALPSGVGILNEKRCKTQLAWL